MKVLDPQGLAEDPARSEILFMRHPETEGNHSHTVVGRTNSPLTELGRYQCNRAVSAITAYNPTAIYSSPLKRCLSIAQPAAAGLGLEAIIDDRVMEIGFGCLETMTVAQVKEKGLSFPWDNEGKDWPVEGGEPIEELFERLNDFINEKAKEITGRGERIVVVCHGGIIRAVLAVIMGIPVSKMWSCNVPNVSSMRFSIDGEDLYLESFGDTPEEISVRFMK